MIRITHLSGSQKGKIASSANPTVRVGRASDCDVRFDAARDPKVSNHHAEFLFEDGCWFVVDTASTNGTLVEGRRIAKHRLRQGEEVQFGKDGPLLRVEFDAQDGLGGAMKTEAVSVTAVQAEWGQHRVASPAVPAAPRIDATSELSKISSDLQESTDTATAKLAEIAAREVAQERAKAGGVSSGKTMLIMASTLKQVQRATRATTARRWVKVVAAVAGLAAVIVAVMGIVIAQQKRQIEEMVKQKERIDKEIETVEQQISEESEPERLAALEEKLNTLTGNAQSTLTALGKSDKKKAEALAERGDELDRQIRDILRKFDADTYAVPPIFKERLRFHVDELVKAPNLKFIYGRKQRYWPMITRQFSALGLPEELAYVAWAETQFDPKAKSAAGAAGMWQMMASTAQSYGLRVDASVDERYDPDKETRAAARHLANLLAEYGSDSFMLAMASYNRGEAGVRRVLRDIAQEPGGFRKEKRDFWHLYRMKKLPEETREYVPKVLAAVIVSRDAKKLGLEE
jgi:soluble lytic murein transglycosylase-like protein/pSer/pThr/pTyr-binding forkhead associated (FHA) protein